MRAFVVFAALLAASGCSANSGKGAAMTTYGYAFPPPAFNAFCATNRSLCSTAGRKVVTLTPALKAELQKVNSEVNRSVAQRSDAGSRGRDSWQVAGATGDCEDIAIRKKKELLKRGWPASALLLTVARLGSGDDGHTLLTVRTSSGDLILDNLTSSVRNWSDTRYRFFARQAPGNAGKWEQIR